MEGSDKRDILNVNGWCASRNKVGKHCIKMGSVGGGSLQAGVSEGLR